MAESHEALERFEKAHEAGHGSGLAKTAALTVAIIAAFLAVSTFLGNESVKEAIQGQTKVADQHAQAQTFENENLVYQLQNLLFSTLTNSSDASLAKAATTSLKVFQGNDKEIATEQKALKEKLKDAQKDVKKANDQHLYYEISEVLLQIAIVLASVSIISDRRIMLWGGGAVAVIGVAVLSIGYTK
jgi:hypothetical protein